MDTVDFKSPVQNALLPPVLSQECFASLIGVSKDTVRGWVENSTVPVVKIGRQRYINTIAFAEQLKAGKTIFQRGDYCES
jgi:excisionase family DNA binding protein